MRNRHSFPCILKYENEVIYASFPDLEGCTALGSTEEEVIFHAKESLGMFIHDLEIKEEYITPPTKLHELSVQENEVLTLIEVYMPLYREIAKDRSVKKTLTIPKWLDEAALEHGINFSKVLQEGLKQKLGIERKKDF